MFDVELIIVLLKDVIPLIALVDCRPFTRYGPFTNALVTKLNISEQLDFSWNVGF